MFWNKKKEKTKEPTPEKEKLKAGDILEAKPLIDHYSNMVSGQLRGVINTKAREENKESIRWGLTNIHNFGYEQGYEQGKRDLLQEFREREG